MSHVRWQVTVIEASHHTKWQKEYKNVDWLVLRVRQQQHDQNQMHERSSWLCSVAEPPWGECLNRPKKPDSVLPRRNPDSTTGNDPGCQCVPGNGNGTPMHPETAGSCCSCPNNNGFPHDLVIKSPDRESYQDVLMGTLSTIRFSVGLYHREPEIVKTGSADPVRFELTFRQQIQTKPLPRQDKNKNDLYATPTTYLLLLLFPLSSLTPVDSAQQNTCALDFFVLEKNNGVK